MKTSKLLGAVEHEAGRQVTRLIGAARKRYDRFMRSAAEVSDPAAQRRYIRAAEQTVASAEKIIAELKKRIAIAKKLVPGTRQRPTKRKSKRRTKRAVKRQAKRAARLSSRKKRR